MTSSIGLYRPAATAVITGGTPVVAMYGPVVGGIIQNPAKASDQGLGIQEVLFVDITGNPAGIVESATTSPIQPGATFVVPPGTTNNISVNAKSSGHRFSGVVLQPPPSPTPTPQPGTFPPSGPTTLTQTLPSYLYEQYDDDSDLQAFVDAYNAISQAYVTWFATVGLPVYTNVSIAGTLLDWVAQGLYGMSRPSLSSGRNRDIGPLNTYAPNILAPNQRKTIGASNVVATSDDVFKRIMTWNFYKGDGNTFTVRWLKRRIMRFLLGVNGTAPNIDNTYPVSVTYGNGFIAIRISVGTRSILGGAFPNRCGCNRLTPNALITAFNPGPVQYPLESVLQEAILSGAVQLPFQYEVSVAI